MQDSLSYVESIRGCPYMTQAKLATEFSISRATVGLRIKEIEAEMKDGRYSDYPHTIIRDGRIVLINQLVFVDYMTYRRQLLDRNARKYVPEYEPDKIVRELGWNNRIVSEAV